MTTDQLTNPPAEPDAGQPNTWGLPAEPDRTVMAVFDNGRFEWRRLLIGDDDAGLDGWISPARFGDELSRIKIHGWRNLITDFGPVHRDPPANPPAAAEDVGADPAATLAELPPPSLEGTIP